MNNANFNINANYVDEDFAKDFLIKETERLEKEGAEITNAYYYNLGYTYDGRSTTSSSKYSYIYQNGKKVGPPPVSKAPNGSWAVNISYKL